MTTAVLFIAALHCEFLSKPIGVETPEPRLGWALRAPERGQYQSAYQMLVASAPEILARQEGDLWDSGKVHSGQSANVHYAGAPLRSGQRVFWKVRVWDQENRPSDWSGPAIWEMGKLSPTDWQAKWIAAPPQPPGSPPSLDDLPRSNAPAAPESIARMLAPEPQNGAPQIRREFQLQEKPLKTARAYICGLGLYELSINGRVVEDAAGPRVLEPAQTDYEQRALYSIYDLLPFLGARELAVGIVLGNGFYNQRAVWGDLTYGKPCCIAQFEIEYADGTRDTFVTDETWKVQRGPILMNNIYAGEHYDARQETPGWDAPGFDDSGWFSAAVVPSPTKRLESHLMPSERIIERRAPVAQKETAPGVWTFDFGQNVTGWAGVEARGDAGTVVRMRYAEDLDAEGRIDTTSTGVRETLVEQADTYVCKGSGIPEFWKPRFTYHGFRYVEVTGLTRPPAKETLAAFVVHTEAPANASFECSDPVLNQLHAAALWTLRGNLHGIPTDCPTREKSGWLGDANLTAETYLYNFYLPHFWRKYINDIETSRGGKMPKMIAPGNRKADSGTPDYAIALITLPWFVYLQDGDESTLSQHYAGMRELIEQWRLETNDDNLLPRGVGEHSEAAAEQTPVAFTSTACMYQATTIMAQAANVLGETADADRYRALARRTAEALVAASYRPAESSFGTQTMNALALQLGFAPADARAAIADTLARSVTAPDGRRKTGNIGTRFLFPALGSTGHADLALGLLQSREYPGFAHLLGRGATTLWERWGDLEDVLSRPDAPFPRSRNHAVSATFDAWLYSGLAGISPDPARPGFRRTNYAPQVVDGLTYVKASVGSLYGNNALEWSIETGQLTCRVSVPTNTDARLALPVAAASLTEGGKALPSVPEVHVLRVEPPCELSLVSGDYEFTTPWPPVETPAPR